MSRSKHLSREDSGDIVMLQNFHQTIQRYKMRVLNIPKHGEEQCLEKLGGDHCSKNSSSDG